MNLIFFFTPLFSIQVLVLALILIMIYTYLEYNMKHLPYYLALNRMNNIGPATVMQLETIWPNLSAMFQLSYPQLKEAGLSSTIAQRISSFDFKEVELDLAWLNLSSQHHLITWHSEHYPPLLKEISYPPFVLYAKGQLSALKLPKLAIVGSRNPSITGLENAKQFAKSIAAHSIAIVSGLALGIDAQAHKGALEAQGQTIAVIGTGIDCIYPYRHIKLAEQISENGLILSEFPLKSSPKAGHFPRRNRIISGLSLCTLVVEAAIKSGSLITARMALEQNREVLAIPGSIHNPLAKGCHHLLQQGAKLVTTASDILEEYQIESIQRADNSIFSLASKNENLVKFIGFETTNVDKIIERSGLSIDKITAQLAELEILGEIISVPGGYMRC